MGAKANLNGGNNFNGVQTATSPTSALPLGLRGTVPGVQFEKTGGKSGLNLYSIDDDRLHVNGGTLNNSLTILMSNTMENYDLNITPIPGLYFNKVKSLKGNFNFIGFSYYNVQGTFDKEYSAFSKIKLGEINLSNIYFISVMQGANITGNAFIQNINGVNTIILATNQNLPSGPISIPLLFLFLAK